MSEILDRGSLLWASVAVLAVSLLLQASVVPVLMRAQVAAESAAAVKTGVAAPADEGIQPPPARHLRSVWFSFHFYTPLLLLAIFYVPGTLLLSSLIAGQGALGTVFRRDYSPLMTCTSLAWAAANAPLAPAAWLLPLPAFGIVAALAYLYFGVLMFFAVRTVSGVGNSQPFCRRSRPPRRSLPPSRSGPCWAGSRRRSFCSSPITIWAANLVTWAQECAAARPSAACWTRPR